MRRRREVPSDAEVTGVRLRRRQRDGHAIEEGLPILGEGAVRLIEQIQRDDGDS